MTSLLSTTTSSFALESLSTTFYFPRRSFVTSRSTYLPSPTRLRSNTRSAKLQVQETSSSKLAVERLVPSSIQSGENPVQAASKEARVGLFKHYNAWARRNSAVQLDLWKSVRDNLVTYCLLAAMLSNLPSPGDYDTFENVPQSLSGGDTRPRRIQKPKSVKAETCTRKCVGTCIRGGAGAPGEGPLNVRKPLVVFKEGFRSRQYCLVECSEICNLIGDQDSGP